MEDDDREWQQAERDRFITVVPLGDIVTHDETNTACVCGPKVIFGGAGWRARKQIIQHVRVGGSG